MQFIEQRKENPIEEIRVTLAGNPNVGKSTVFNALTGMHQHTGNWAGKTVQNARGTCSYGGRRIQITDIPGAYSLYAQSAEEAVARDAICSGDGDVIIVVCDAGCLARNMNLVLQILEVTSKVVVCVNLLDEAEKKNICVDTDLLGNRLGVPVVGTSARDGKGLDALMNAVLSVAAMPAGSIAAYQVHSVPQVESVLQGLEPHGRILWGAKWRWAVMRLLEGDPTPYRSISAAPGDLFEGALEEARQRLASCGLTSDALRDLSAMRNFSAGAALLQGVLLYGCGTQKSWRGKLDVFLTSRRTGLPVMLLLLTLVFYLTIAGANVPSQMLADLFGQLERLLHAFFIRMQIQPFFRGLLLDGMFRTLSFVISVMLPPMAIFFPLFTLLEDLGYLPRVAFNLDRRFRKCGGCGKQALTMWVVDSRTPFSHCVFLDCRLHLKTIEYHDRLMLHLAVRALFIVTLPNLYMVDELEQQLRRQLRYVGELSQQLVELVTGSLL